MKFDIRAHFEKSVEKIKVLLKFDKSSGNFSEDLSIFKIAR
jgi:hypothetical protein